MSDSLQAHQASHSCRQRHRSLRVLAGVTDVLGVLAFSALPFATVQALADSELGKNLQARCMLG